MSSVERLRADKLVNRLQRLVDIYMNLATNLKFGREVTRYKDAVTNLENNSKELKMLVGTLDYTSPHYYNSLLVLTHLALASSRGWRDMFMSIQDGLDSGEFKRVYASLEDILVLLGDLSRI